MAHCEFLVLILLIAIGVLVRAPPLLQYPHVGGDPFVHYRYAIALLEGKLSIPIEAGGTGTTVELYYPPLFHLVSLSFFLAFPKVDPYAIMKILASSIDALQIVPIYLIVKRISGSGVGGLIAAYCLLVIPNGYQMLTWGGYANIAGLLFFAILVYSLITDRWILAAASTAALGLTHHLSTLFAAAVLLPYFVVLLWRKRISKSVGGVLLGGGLSFVAFYSFVGVNLLLLLKVRAGLRSEPVHDTLRP